MLLHGCCHENSVNKNRGEAKVRRKETGLRLWAEKGREDKWKILNITLKENLPCYLPLCVKNEWKWGTALTALSSSSSSQLSDGDLDPSSQMAVARTASLPFTLSADLCDPEERAHFVACSHWGPSAVSTTHMQKCPGQESSWLRQNVISLTPE